MNIFFLSSDPKKCAKYYCNEHLNKMTVETVQMLNWAHYDSSGMVKLTEKDLSSFPRKSGFYRFNKSYYNHTITRWVRASDANWNWALELAEALTREYFKFRGKVHACKAIIDWLKEHKPKLPKANEISLPGLSFGKYQTFLEQLSPKLSIKKIIKLYKYYYALSKTFATWKGRKEPKWYKRYKGYAKNSYFVI